MINEVLNDLWAAGITLVFLAFVVKLLFGNRGIGTSLYSNMSSGYKKIGSEKDEKTFKNLAEENNKSANRYFLPLLIVGVIFILISLVSKI